VIRATAAAVGVVSGAALVLLAALPLTVATTPLLAVGALAVLAGPAGRLPHAGTLAALCALISVALHPPGIARTAALAALLLGYLLALAAADTGDCVPVSALVRPAMAAAALAALALAALFVPTAPSAVLAIIAAPAAIAAALIALPPREKESEP
jgi:hypothetical protein